VVIHYTINSRVAASTAVKGRDLVYLLPKQSIRVASMVPADAVDIRDAAGEDFGTVESLDFRSRVLEIVALTSVAFGVLVMAIVLVGYARRDARRAPADERLVPTRGIVRAAASELAAVQRERDQQGWNETLAGRALAGHTYCCRMRDRPEPESTPRGKRHDQRRPPCGAGTGAREAAVAVQCDDPR